MSQPQAAQRRSERQRFASDKSKRAVPQDHSQGSGDDPKKKNTPNDPQTGFSDPDRFQLPGTRRKGYWQTSKEGNKTKRQHIQGPGDFSYQHGIQSPCQRGPEQQQVPREQVRVQLCGARVNNSDNARRCEKSARSLRAVIFSLRRARQR